MAVACASLSITQGPAIRNKGAAPLKRTLPISKLRDGRMEGFRGRSWQSPELEAEVASAGSRALTRLRRFPTADASSAQQKTERVAINWMAGERFQFRLEMLSRSLELTP